jgi:hypothetical protein
MKWFCVAFVAAERGLRDCIFSLCDTRNIHWGPDSVRICVFVGRGYFCVLHVYSARISSEDTELYTTLRNTEIHPKKGLCRRGVYIADEIKGRGWKNVQFRRDNILFILANFSACMCMCVLREKWVRESFASHFFTFTSLWCLACACDLICSTGFAAPVKAMGQLNRKIQPPWCNDPATTPWKLDYLLLLFSLVNSQRILHPRWLFCDILCAHKSIN